MSPFGRFITFEGGEGSGKSTQIKAAARHLEKKGRKVVLTREPGGCPSAESIRALLLTGSTDRWQPMTEVFLFMAARVEHLVRVVIPALNAGNDVLCDRFVGSTLAYQGAGYGTDHMNMVWDLHVAMCESLVGGGLPGGGLPAPHYTLFFDVDPEIGLARSFKRQSGSKKAEIRFEQKEIEFHRNLRAAFSVIRDNYLPGGFIDAGLPIDEVEQATISAIDAIYRSWN